MIKSTYAFIISSSLLAASDDGFKTPEAIQQELQLAETEFEVAQKMFSPWYTGPLITGSASNVAPGHLMLQPYLYLTMNYAAFNNHRKSLGTPNSYVINPLMVVQTGILNWMDITIVPGGVFKWQQSEFGDGFSDLPVQIGFQLTKETPYIPKMRLIIGETFPTGTYQRLNPSRIGLDSSGAGAFQTVIGLNMSKVFWWAPLHPTALRFSGNYNIPNSKVTVHGYNTYGGGKGTEGKVKVGGTLNLDLGLEISLNQQWVFATDIVYVYTGKSTFSGNPGEALSNGAPTSDQLSLSPAIEYNLNDYSGFIGGVWFPVTGRNSPNFISLIFSYYIAF